MYSVENPDYDHSRIIETDNDGTILSFLPYLNDTDYMFSPEPDPNYNRPQKVITPEGEMLLPAFIPEGKVATGENVFVQMIYRYVKKLGSATEEDIIRHMTQEKRFIPRTSFGVRLVRYYIFHMHKGKLRGLIIQQHEPTISTKGKKSKEKRFYTGVELKIGRQLLDIIPGYDPYEYHICRFIENKGLTNRDEIHRYVIDRLKWARGTTIVERYIKTLLKKKSRLLCTNTWFYNIS